MVHISALEVAIKRHRRLDCVERDLVTLSVSNVSPSSTGQPNIHTGLEIRLRLHHAFIDRAAAARRSLPVLVVTCVCIGWSPHQPLHSLDRIGVRWQVGLILPAINYLLVVWPSNFLVGEKVITSLLLLSFYLML